MARRRLLLVITLVIGMSFLPASPTGAVDVCGTSVGPGGKVVLDMDQSCNSDPAITVVGPVSLDLNGFKVTCTSSSQDGILVEGTGAKLLDGVVTACDVAVSLSGSKHTVERVVAQASDGSGFVNYAPKSRFTNNTSVGNDGEGFSNRNAASKCRFTGNTATGNDRFGFANGGAGSTFSNNTASGNGLGGFVNGFTARGNNFNTFSKNTATGNQGDGFRNLSNGNKFSGNASMANGGSGFRNWVQASGNTFKGNVALGNQDTDLKDDNADCDDNTWKNKLFGTSDAAGVPDPECIE